MAPLTNLRIPRGQLILVTGANGYISSHVVDALLHEGYRVRGTLRRDMADVKQHFDENHGKGQYETVIVPSMEEDSAFNDAVRGVAGIIHLASNLSTDPDPLAVIPQTVAGTVNILEAAAREPSVRGVVITSSCTAAYSPEPDRKRVVDEMEAAWCDDTPASKRGFQVYIASKVESEKAAWAWMQKNKPGFVLNTILPGFNTGPILSPAFHGSTMQFVRGLLQGQDAVFKLLPPQWHIDVRDDAKLHVAALLDPNTQHRRLFAFSKPFRWSRLVDVLKRHRPENRAIPEPPAADDWLDGTELPPLQVAQDCIKSVFGESEYIDLEESVVSGIADLE